MAGKVIEAFASAKSICRPSSIRMFCADPPLASPVARTPGIFVLMTCAMALPIGK
jgi:hypothetical protein